MLLSQFIRFACHVLGVLQLARHSCLSFPQEGDMFQRLQQHAQPAKICSHTGTFVFHHKAATIPYNAPLSVHENFRVWVPEGREGLHRRVTCGINAAVCAQQSPSIFSLSMCYRGCTVYIHHIYTHLCVCKHSVADNSNGNFALSKKQAADAARCPHCTGCRTFLASECLHLITTCTFGKLSRQQAPRGKHQSIIKYSKSMSYGYNFHPGNHPAQAMPPHQTTLIYVILSDRSFSGRVALSGPGAGGHAVQGGQQRVAGAATVVHRLGGVASGRAGGAAAGPSRLQPVQDVLLRCALWGGPNRIVCAPGVGMRRSGYAEVGELTAKTRG